MLTTSRRCIAHGENECHVIYSSFTDECQEKVRFRSFGTRPTQARSDSKLVDILVRVRYSNPLPPPPCPPKLLDIPTDPLRYARPEFLNAIANDTPLPMIVDAECGMPLDLSLWESLWDEDADDSGAWASCTRGSTDTIDLRTALNPDPDNLPTLDPKDRFLLGDPSSSSTPFSNGPTSGVVTSSSTPLPAHVPWLRKTEYLSREGVQRSQSIQEMSVPTAFFCKDLLIY